MANNFGGAQYGMNPGNNVSGWNNAIPTTSPSLSIMPSNSREFSEQYPLAPNATMVFINYNQKKLWIKTEHPNGLGYDFEDFNLLSNNDLAVYQQVQNSMQQNQNGFDTTNFVTREEFDKLKKSFEEFIK